MGPIALEVVYIAGGALVIPLFIAVAAIGLVAASATIEIGALATETVTRRSFPAAWDSRRHKRHAVKTASAGRAKRSSRLRSWLRFLTAPAIAYWWWWLALAATGLALSIAAVPAMNYLLFEQFLKLALRGVERSHGMVVTYQSAEGNLLKGRANLRGARLQRNGHATSDFDLTVARLDVDCDARRLISGEFALESVVMRSVRGQFMPTAKSDSLPSRRYYTIDRLTIGDAKFDYIDRSHPPGIMQVPLQVTTLEIEDYRSRWSLFDVLFRSDTTGKIYGRPFEISSHSTAEANESVFRVTDLPLSLLGQRITVPLGGQVTGLVDANIRTRWQPRDEATDLKMNCHLVAHSFTVHMPNGLVQRAMAPTVASRVPRHMPMEFQMVMDKRVFDGQTSFFATGILENIGEEANRQRRPMSSRPSTRSTNVFRRFGAGVRSLVNPRGR